MTDVSLPCFQLVIWNLRLEPPLDLQYTRFLSHEYFKTFEGSSRDNLHEKVPLYLLLLQSIKFYHHFIYTEDWKTGVPKVPHCAFSYNKLAFCN